MTPRALYLFLHESAFLQPATGGQMIHSRPLRVKKGKTGFEIIRIYVDGPQCRNITQNCGAFSCFSNVIPSRVSVLLDRQNSQTILIYDRKLIRTSVSDGQAIHRCSRPFIPKANRYFCLLFICIFVFNYLFIFYFLSRTCRPECLNETQRLTLVTKPIVNCKLLLQFVDGASVVALFRSKQNCYSGLVYILHIYIWKIFRIKICKANVATSVSFVENNKYLNLKLLNFKCLLLYSQCQFITTNHCGDYSSAPLAILLIFQANYRYTQF